MNRPKYELINSPSELRLRVYGTSAKELFENALQAMFESAEPIFENKAPVSRQLDLRSLDQESLLIDFLSEALTLSDIYNEAYDVVHIEQIDERHLVAEIKGRKVRGFEIEIKAVTHHDVKIVSKLGQLSTEIVLDI